MNWTVQKKRITKSNTKPAKSKFREWVDALVFAVIAASIIRTFVVEAYTIPTPSMEKSLLVGDFLFVSKMHYGARIPETPLSFPFAHNTMPLFGGNSYLTWIKLPYNRLPGFQSIKNNDIVVFNWPQEDFRPVDKRENYIKRCIAISGDTLEVRNGEVFLNGKKNMIFPGEQDEYLVTTDGTAINEKILKDLHITEMYPSNETGKFGFHLTQSNIEDLKKLRNVKSIDPYVLPKGFLPETIFPMDAKNFPWNIDNYGPIWIPKKGVTVPINTNNIALYQRLITIYEGHQLDINKNGTIIIDGHPVTSYTFAMNYYWMMGDNRHNSLDSRYWGFVPEDHVVGKAWFIWMSWDKDGSLFTKVRWDRLFRGIN
ncbi:MAG: signal peptidase I [Chitinophagales bacterium]|nr:signal peptidase I [Chitinophagales bacterium]